MKDKKVVYEPHPVSTERKAEIVADGCKIIDAVFAPEQSRPKKGKAAKDEN